MKHNISLAFNWYLRTIVGGARADEKPKAPYSIDHAHNEAVELKTD